MKTKIFIISLLIICLGIFNACKKEQEKDRSLLKIDLQSQFTNNHVKIYIDNRLVFDKLITTSPSIGLADSYSDTLSNQTHKIKIIVDNQDQTEFLINLKTTTYVGLNYYTNNPTHFSRMIQAQPFMYD